MSKSKIIILIVVAVLLAAGAIWFFGFLGSAPMSSGVFKSLNLFGDKEKSASGQGSGEPDVSGWQEYVDERYGFSFQHPQGFKTSSFSDESGETILVHPVTPTNGSNGVKKEGGQGFQIFISEFDEFGPLSEERIRQDLPEMAIESPQEVGLPAGSPTSPSVSALIFFSVDESLGRTREIWFVWPQDPSRSGNYLYQITSPAEFDEQLSKIMATWKFN